MDRRFTIDDEITRQYRRFGAVGTQLTVRLLPPSDDDDTVNHFVACVNDLFEYALQNVSDSDMVGMTIQNRLNQNDKPIGTSFRRKDQLSGDVVGNVFEKISQSNSRFNAMDPVVITLHSVIIPVGSGRGIKTMDRQLSVMAHINKSIVEVKTESNCLAWALIIAIARVKNDSNYKSYRDGWKIRPVVRNLLETKGIDLTNGAGLPKIAKFQEHFREYKIVVYQGLSCDNMFAGHVESNKRLNLLYDDVERHYHVITNLTGDMAKKYVCKACGKSCRSDTAHNCDQTCSACMTSLPCAFEGIRIPCDECNRHFRSQNCYDNHKIRATKKKPVCERKRRCGTCGEVVIRENNECNKR